MSPCAAERLFIQCPSLNPKQVTKPQSSTSLPLLPRRAPLNCTSCLPPANTTAYTLLTLSLQQSAYNDNMNQEITRSGEREKGVK